MVKNTELLKKAYHKIEESKDLIKSDYHRLKYHVMPPVGLLNDPNGFIHINGEYHLFYQFHPFDTKHGLKYWGHVKSRDLVNWEEMPIALAPSEWYETHGCYSGSAVNNNGIFTLMYTGNVKDEKGNRESYQCIATSRDGITFEKWPGNPVIHNQPKGYTRHFRDPKVWKKGANWYMVIGAQTVEEQGRVLLYKSHDIKKWEMIGEVTGSNLNNLGYFGYMWECPDLFELNGKDVLIACPQGLQPQGDFYNNIYQAGYFIGKLDYSTGRLNHGKFTELDRGFEFYAPQTMLDEKGRRILIAWMGLPEREDHPTIDYGWIHAMTIPRVLHLVGDKIYQRPVEEIKTLRKKPISYKQIEIKDEEIELEGICGDVIEILVECEIRDATQFGIKLRCSDDGTQQTVVSYDKLNNIFKFDRERSGKGYGGIRRCTLKRSQILKLNIFLDTSSVEIFVNDGEEVFTGRVYPDKDSKGIKFFAQGGSVNVKTLEKWEL
jgi:beta-fructofuranosidase